MDPVCRLKDCLRALQAVTVRSVCAWYNGYIRMFSALEDLQQDEEEEAEEENIMDSVAAAAATDSDCGETGFSCAAAAIPLECSLQVDCEGMVEKKWSSTQCDDEEEEDELQRSSALLQGGGITGHEEGDDDTSNAGSETKRARSGPSGESRLSSGRGSEKSELVGSVDDSLKRLMILQMRELSFHVEEGVMVLLKRCLESEQDSQAGTQSSALAMCSYVEHFESRLGEDLGWGCGWRNIQMMSSYLLEGDDEIREALFGGVGFVPDIFALQQWLEIAWAKGFDSQGAEHFSWKIVGTHKWIGTTECAALLRSFGVRARIVDFQSVGNKRERRESLLRDKSGSVVYDHSCSRQKPQVVAPLVLRAPVEIVDDDCVGCGEYIIDGPRFRKSFLGNTDMCPTCMEQLRKSSKQEDQETVEEYMGREQTATESREETGYDDHLPQPSVDVAPEGFTFDHQHLIDWVWNYFAGKEDTGSSNSSSNSSSSSSPSAAKIIITNRSPLYFQHKGHSRTVVGIQRRKAAEQQPGSSSSNSKAAEAFLLILDPSQRTPDIEKCLRAKSGWQRLVKRSTQTLQQPEYQLCYVERGVAHGEELEALKLLSSIHYTY
ncbi:hypothetical protein CY35_06G004700 [Sphagnum magellanicum]|nr:hypothetical protein CY35_06G004700 [Sphagnum magellanicum]